MHLRLRLRLRNPPRKHPLPLNQIPQTLACPQSRHAHAIRSSSKLPALAAPRANAPGALCRRALGAVVAPHAEALDAPQLVYAVDGDDEAEDGAPRGDAPETEIGFLNEVLEVHAVEGGDEGAGGEGKGEYGEAQVEKHERVAVGVEDGFDAGHG